MNEVFRKAREVMTENNLCVFSTLGETGPESALVGFAEDENGRLIIGTSNTSRKYHNVLQNERVSVVIGGWTTRRTVQYEGRATILSGNEGEKYKAIHVAKHPKNAEFADRRDQVYILVQPTWVRHTDASNEPWTVEETEDFAL